MLILAFLLVASISSTVLSLNDIEYVALKEFYDSLGGSNWMWNSSATGLPWDFTEIQDPCAENWQGIQCIDNSITVLALSEHNLAGFVPESIGTFQNLRLLDLSYNNLQGYLPTEQFGNFSLLESFNVYGCLVSGNFGDETLRKLANLVFWNIGDNYFTGSPAFPIHSPNITFIELNFNIFQGSIPLEVGNLTQLTYLSMGESFISGTLPVEICKLTKLQQLIIRYTSISGNISDCIMNMTSLVHLDLSVNSHMQASIPEHIGNLVNLQVLDLSNMDMLHQTIPESITRLTALTYLDFSYSRIGGTVPAGLSRLRNLTTLMLGSNRFTGTLQLNYSNFKQMQYLTVANNFLQGTLPQSMGEMTLLQSLYLGNNRFYGTLPASLGNLTALRQLDVSINNLQGTILTEFSRFRSLETLSLAMNNFTGTLPPELGGLSKLQLLDVSDNRLRGSLPASYGNFLHMQMFRLSDNSFSGTIPASLGSWIGPYSFAVNDNNFGGSLPEELAHMIYNVSLLYLQSNSFTGTLPSYFCGPQATQVNYSYNRFHGTIPRSIQVCDFMDELYLSNNHLSSSLPHELGFLDHLWVVDLSQNSFSGPLLSSWENLTLNYFDVADNHFTGELPELFFLRKTHLGMLGFSNNQFTGTLPLAMATVNPTYLYLDGNHFTGAFPNFLTSMSGLAELYLHHNSFSGTLPQLTQNMLQLIKVQHNLFTGPVADKFNNRTMFQLSNVDLSNNEFTGELPLSLFRIKTLLSFAAIGNCLEVTLTEEMCTAPKLMDLALDGLQTAPACRIKYFPSFDGLSTYSVRKPQKDYMPWCLLNMPSLQTLHLSGNLLAGSIPQDLAIGPHMTALSLSHNLLSGTVPAALSGHAWTMLDLSFNKITGQLAADVPNNVSLSLQDNRLSGDIPPEVSSLSEVNILEGNLFNCDGTRNALPPADPATPTYECGSKSFDDSLWLWISLFGTCLMLAAVLFYLQSKRVRELTWRRFEKLMRAVDRVKLSVYAVFMTAEAVPSIVEVAELGSRMRVLALWLLIGLLTVVLPTVVVLNDLYPTYEHQYSWSAASVYIAGTTPGAILMALYLVLMVFVCWGLYSGGQQVAPGALSSPESSEPSKWSVMKAMWILLTCLLDMTVMLTVNIGYVLIYSEYDAAVVTAAQFGMALFKLLWNNLAMQRMISFTKRCLLEENSSPQRSDVLMFVCLSLFNNIAAPFVATAATNVDCYYYVLHAPPTVYSMYRFYPCMLIENNICETRVVEFQTSSYLPPFNYSYQCSSAFVTSYAAIYVYMYIFNGFLMFMAQGLLKYAQTMDGGSRKSRWSKVVEHLLPPILRERHRAAAEEDSHFEVHDTELMPVMVDSGSSRSACKKETLLLFDKGKYVERNISHLAILVTFGFAFPPLAPIVTFSIFSYTYFTQFCLGHVLLRRRDALTALLDEQCKDTFRLFYRCVWVVVPFACLFYSMFLMDIVGDSVGWRKALWAPLTLALFPLASWLLRMHGRWMATKRTTVTYVQVPEERL